MKTQQFLATHPVFRVEELGQFLAQKGSANVRARNSLLAYHANAGRAVQVRRGLYATVPLGQTPETVQPDRFLLASRMAPDAVLAYHTALEFHGRAYTVFEELTYLTHLAARPTRFRESVFRPVSHPKPLLEKGCEDMEIEVAERHGLDVRVTSLERTLVDVLDRIGRSGGWEEVWRSLESVPYFHLDRVVEYAIALGNATTVAKVGFYIAQHAEQLMADEGTIARLKAHIPKSPHYASRTDREPSRLVGEWNIIVPASVLERRWEAVQ